jgi:hypothetical protein
VHALKVNVSRIICRHWQQICCSSRLYDGLFGEGCLRASANQARVLTRWPGLLDWTLRVQAQAACRVCAQLRYLQTTRQSFLITSPLPATRLTIPVPFHSCPRLPLICTLESHKNNSTRRVSFQKIHPQLRLQSTCRTALVCKYIYHSTMLYSEGCC